MTQLSQKKEFDINIYAKRVDEALDAWLPEQELEISRNLNEAVRYTVLAGGKRIRAVLCLLVAETLDCVGESALRLACVLELIHSYSLIHDDLPALDNDDYRRKKPTNHKVYGEATAILAGDSLLTLAFEWISNLDSFGLSDSQIIKISKLVSYAIGARGMIGGQMLDLYHETVPATLAELQMIHSLKTGALITASVLCGAIIGNASNADYELLRDFAQKAGLLFQIIDDILDAEGDFSTLGKTPGKDQKQNKSTYPSILGLDESRQYAAKIYSECCSLITRLPSSFCALKNITDLIYKRNN